MILLLIKYMYTSKSLTFSITLFVLLFDCKSSHIWRSNRTHPPEVIFQGIIQYNLSFHLYDKQKNIISVEEHDGGREFTRIFSECESPAAYCHKSKYSSKATWADILECWPILIFYIVKSGSRKNLYQFQSVKRFEE